MSNPTTRKPRRPYDPVQPIAAVLDDEHLPEPVHPAAKAWRELDDAARDAARAWHVAQGMVKPAQVADRDAALRAAEDGTPAPMPADAHEAQALADIDAAALRLGKARERKQAAGKVLLAALVEHRPELESIAAARAAKAAEQYEAALGKAEGIITQAAAALSTATAPLGVLGELDREPRLRYEVSTPAWPVAPVDATATRRDLKRIREAAEWLTREPEPAEPIERTEENAIGYVRRRKAARV